MINFFPQALTSHLQQLLRLVQPGGQAVDQLGLAERAALFGEQGAGLHPVYQAQPNGLVALRQSAQQHLLGPGHVTKVSGLQRTIAQLFQSVVQLVQGGGEWGHGFPQLSFNPTA